MFTVNDYSSDCKTLKIEFDKHLHQVPMVVDGKNMGLTDGRYDTCCHIFCGDSKVSSYNGKALLNPNDQLDRVLGKKVALTKAMIDYYFITELPNGTVVKEPIYWNYFHSKEFRTEIWKAFWEWVGSWGTQTHILGTTGKQYSGLLDILRKDIGLEENKEKT